MKQINIILVIILSSYTTRSQQQNPPKDSNVIENRIHQVEKNLISWVKLDSNQNWNILDRMKAYNINGVSVAVIKNYKVDWVKSYGWADTLEKRAVTNQTLFQAASIGKSLNGFGYMRLVQTKRVALDKDINTYLKRWKFPYDTVSHGKCITLAELLSHTAGLSVHGFDGYRWTDSLPTVFQSLDGKKPANNPAVRSEFKPGLKFQYSGGGNMISQLMLEDITGMAHDKYLEQTVFKPLKMNSSFYTPQPYPEYKTRLATGYRYDGKSIGCKYHIYPEHCGAGLWTTAGDLAKFVIEIQLSLKGRSNKVISKEIATLMLTPYIQSSNAAFGFFIDKKEDEYYFQHSGLNEGFSSQYYGSMKGGNGVVVLVNSDNTDFMAEVVNSVATVYGWKKFFDFARKKIVPVPDSITDRYIGQYKFDKTDNGPSIVKENGILYLVDPNSPVKWEIYFTKENEFFVIVARWANQRFFTGERGQIKGFYILGDNYKVTVNKIDP